MTEVKYRETDSGYRFEWGDPYGIVANVNRLRTASDDQIRGELEIVTGEGVERRVLLVPTRFNFSSERTRTMFAKDLTKKLAVEIEWKEIFDALAYHVQELVRQGERACEVWPEDGPLAPEYLLEPLLYLNLPTVIFGDYGSLKSLMALVVAYVAQLPLHDNGLGLTPQAESSRVLFVDYEDDVGSFQRRWGGITRGFRVEAEMPLLYRRMTGAVADSVDRLSEIIAEHRVKLLIVDSLGPAARGNLNDPEPAIRYHEAIRKLGITSLTLAHTAKDSLTKRRTIFGSVFFSNLARSIWECKAEHEPGENEARVILKHHKANLSKLHPGLGYRFTFSGNTIAVASCDLTDSGLSSELPVPWQIKNLLREGALTARELCEALAKGENTIKPTLTRMAKAGDVVKLSDHKWGLNHDGS